MIIKLSELQSYTVISDKKNVYEQFKDHYKEVGWNNATTTHAPRLCDVST
jgi:hypothetical protein